MSSVADKPEYCEKEINCEGVPLSIDHALRTEDIIHDVSKKALPIFFERNTEGMSNISGYFSASNGGAQGSRG